MDFDSPRFQFDGDSIVFQDLQNLFENCEDQHLPKSTYPFSSLDDIFHQPETNNSNGNILQSSAAKFSIFDSDNNPNLFHASDTTKNILENSSLLPSKGRKGDGGNKKRSHFVRGSWTPEEDKLLTRLVEQHGYGKWSYIEQSFKGKIAKQCRERWINHLGPNIKKDAWSEDEDRILIKAHMEMGKKWSKIAKLLPGRTGHSIKNHWNTTKRRKIHGKHHGASRCSRLGTLLKNYINSLPEEKATQSSISHANILQPTKMHEFYNAPWLQVNYGDNLNGFITRDAPEVQLKRYSETSSFGKKKMDMDLMEMINTLTKLHPDN